MARRIKSLKHNKEINNGFLHREHRSKKGREFKGIEWSMHKMYKKKLLQRKLSETESEMKAFTNLFKRKKWYLS